MVDETTRGGEVFAEGLIHRVDTVATRDLGVYVRVVLREAVEVIGLKAMVEVIFVYVKVMPISAVAKVNLQQVIASTS